MKLLLLLSIALIAQGALAAEVVRLSEPVADTAEYEDFGAALGSTDEAMRLATLLEDAERLAGKPLLVEARISRVCQKKGCFFIAMDGDALVRVSFRDYAFFIPTDTAGRTVTLSGVLVEVERSDAEAAHFAEDLGDDLGGGSAPVKSGPVYEIVADAVRIPKA